MKKSILLLGASLLISASAMAQGFSVFKVENAYTATHLKNNTKTNSVIETIVGMDTDIKNVDANYKLLSGCSFSDSTPYSSDFTLPQVVTIEKKDGTSKEWEVIIHQLKPAKLPLSINFGKHSSCDLTAPNPKPWAGYGIDYRKPTVARFGNFGVGFMVAFEKGASEVSFELNVVGKDSPALAGEFDIQTSVDGKKWKTIKTYTARKPFGNSELETLPLKEDVQFVRWVYAMRENGQNINLNNITVK